MTPHLYLKYDEKPRREGRTLRKIGWVCGTLAETLTLFHTKICDFPYPISDLKPWSPARDRSAQQAVTARTRLASTLKGKWPYRQMMK